MSATTTDPEQRLEDLGHLLPQPPKPVAAYVPSRRTGTLVYISGQIPIKDGMLLARGTVPATVDAEMAVACAVQCTLNGLAALKAEIGSLDHLKQVVRVGCFVASDPGYRDQPTIANGASELLLAIFGDAGRHARAAVGSAALPLGVPVEIEFLFEVE